MSKPSILIVNPYIEDFAAYDHFSKPLGAMLLASALKPHFRLHFVNALNRTHPDIPKMRFRSDGTGHFHKTFIPKPDCLSDIPRRFKRYGIPEELFLRELRNTPFEPDYVFVTSGMTYWASGVRTTNRLIRSVFPRARIVLGGIYASLLPKHAAVYSESDDVCARQMLPNVLQFVSQLTGIDCRTDGLPAPDYELLSEKYYVPVYTSLGCVFDCSYCASSRLSQFTEFPTMQTAQTIVRLAKTQSVRNFAFYDDALLARSETRLNPILKHIAESGIQVRFYTPNGMHIRFLTEETARLMRITGFEDIRLSLESDDPLFQATEGRKTTNIEFESALETLFRAGFESKTNPYLYLGECSRAKLRID